MNRNCVNNEVGTWPSLSSFEELQLARYPRIRNSKNTFDISGFSHCLLSEKLIAKVHPKPKWLAMTYENIPEINVDPLLIMGGEPVAGDATIIFC